MASYTYNSSTTTISSKADSVDFSFDISTAITSANIPPYAKLTKVNITVWGDINTATNTGKMNAYFGSEQIGSETKVGGTANEKSVSEDLSISTFFNSENANSGKLKDTSVRLTVNINGPIMLSKFDHKVRYSVYFEWTPKYLVTFKNGDTVLESKYVLSGTTPSYTGATPTKDSTSIQEVYQFNGWDKTLSAITSNTTYTAQFKTVPREYEIAVYCNELPTGEKIEVTGEGIYKYGDTVTLTALNIPQHYNSNWVIRKIVGSTWEDFLNVTTNPCVFVISGDIASHASQKGYLLTVNVLCEINRYTIKAEVSPENSGVVKDGGSGNDEVPEEGVTTWFGSYVTFTAVANKGYKFVKWSDEVADNPREIRAESDATYTAIF